MRNWIGRLVAAVIAAVLTLLAAPVAEAIALAPAKSPSTYVYDSHHHPALVTGVVTERGPHAEAYDPAVTNAVDLASHGASARPNGATAGPTTTCTIAAPPAQATNAATTTGRQVVVSDGDLSSLQRSEVAANPAIGFAEGLGKTALTPGRLQHGTKNLTKAGVLPAWSGKNSPGMIERALVPILERPTATFNHSLGGTRVRGFLGDIDGNQVALFVYKEGPYQGQLASSFVPSANQLKMWGVP